MWQTDITVDKKLDIENNLLGALDSYDNVLLVGTATDSRNVYSVASNDIRNASELNRIIKRILLVNMKYNYLIEKTEADKNKYTEILLYEILFFDSEYEDDYVDKILSCQYEYSLDGIFNFKMQELVKNWNYIIDLYKKVEGSNDNILSLAGYIHETSADINSRLYMTVKNDNVSIIDTVRGNEVEIINISCDIKSNILASIIRMHPAILYIDKSALFYIDYDIIKEVFEVVTV